MRYALAAVALVALPSVLTAQGTATGSINYTSSVIVEQDMAWGAFDPGVAQTIDLTDALDNGKRAALGLDFNGRTQISITAGALTQIEDLLLNAVTTNAGEFTPTYTCAVLQDNSTTFPASGLNTYDAAPAACAGMTLDLIGNRRSVYWLMVGGDITAAETVDQPAGKYQGTITVTFSNVS